MRHSTRRSSCGKHSAADLQATASAADPSRFSMFRFIDSFDSLLIFPLLALLRKLDARILEA